MTSIVDVELPDQGDNIIKTVHHNVIPNPKGYGHELFTKLKEHKGKIAQIDAESEESDSFDALLERCTRVALHLKKLGVTSEDVVSPCTTNHLNTAVAMVAPLLLGAKIACLDPFTSMFDMKAMVNVAKPKILFVSEEALEKVELVLEELNLEAKIVLFGATDKHIPFKELLTPFSENEEKHFTPYEVENIFETAVITFSSGSTGIPKGICLNHYSILCQLNKLNKMKMISGNRPTSIIYSTLVWISGQINTAQSIIQGTPRMICSIFSVEKTWRYLMKYNIEFLTLPPQDIITFLKHGNPDKFQTPALKLVVIGGGKISIESMKALQKMFLNPVFVTAPYGQTEVCGAVFDINAIFKFSHKPSCVGQPTSGFWYKIVDVEAERICGPNETGELCLKSDLVMNGYYKQDASDRFDSEGYLRTGDMAYYDEEHCFFIVERVREALRYRMHWIPPSLLENILYDHPAVKIAVVIGIPSDVGDIATAVVVKSDSVGDVSETELLNFVNDKVDELKKIRGGIIFVEDSVIPYTPTGKIRKFLLKKRIMESFDDFNVKIEI